MADTRDDGDVAVVDDLHIAHLDGRELPLAAMGPDDLRLEVLAIEDGVIRERFFEECG